MEIGTIRREVYVEASPDIVFDVVSRPEHLRHWWPQEAHLDPTPGSSGELVFRDDGQPSESSKVVPVTVVEARPPHTFSFRWTHSAGERAADGNSLLVTFALSPSGPGTLLTMTETGFRELGWEVAQLEALYADHVVGWEFHLARLSPYAATVGVRT
ncbi:MAG: SRPBCC family protein [Lapillicoccus sp.]